MKLKSQLASLVVETNLAAQRLRGLAIVSPLVRHDWLSAEVDADVYLKLETHQITNSCKIRSAGNFLLANLEAARRLGVVTASTGNNALAHSYLCDALNIEGAVFLPRGADPQKIAEIDHSRLKCSFIDGDIVDCEYFARRYAAETQTLYMSPYNDAKIIAGQGTISKEIIDQMFDVDFIFVTVGGGGLASGISGYLAGVSHKARVIGCLPEASPTMKRSVEAGRIVTILQQPSVSDSSGGIEKDSITFNYCRSLLSSMIMVSEHEIKSAMRLMYCDPDKYRLEGAAALPVAALLKNKNKYRGKRIVVCICGANIGSKLFDECVSVKNPEFLSEYA